jgi:hypothetical protein
VYTSRHFFEERKENGVTGPVIFSINNPETRKTEMFKAVSYKIDSSGLDIVQVTLERCPDSKIPRAKPMLTEQPIGRHAIFHHAGGKGCQVSTGDIVDFDTNYQQVGTQSIIVEAGSGASGAGVFNSEGNMIGIMTFRTNRYGKIARDMVLLSQSSFFNSSPMYVPSMGTSVRPDWDQIMCSHSLKTGDDTTLDELYNSGFEVYKKIGDLVGISNEKIEQLKKDGKISNTLYLAWQKKSSQSSPNALPGGGTVKHNNGDYKVYIDNHQKKHSASWEGPPYTGGKGSRFPKTLTRKGTKKIASEIIEQTLTQPPKNRAVNTNPKLMRLSKDDLPGLNKKNWKALKSPKKIGVHYFWSAELQAYAMHFYPKIPKK